MGYTPEQIAEKTARLNSRFQIVYDFLESVEDEALLYDIEAIVAEGRRRGYSVQQVAFGREVENYPGLIPTLLRYAEGRERLLPDNDTLRQLRILRDEVEELRSQVGVLSLTTVAAADSASSMTRELRERRRDTRSLQDALASTEADKEKLSGSLVEALAAANLYANARSTGASAIDAVLGELMPDEIRGVLLVAQSVLGGEFRGLSESDRATLAKYVGTLRDPQRIADLRLRRAVYRRDDYRCCRCGSMHNLRVDHIIPWSRGGETEIDNLQTLCESCNARKYTRTEDHRRPLTDS